MLLVHICHFWRGMHAIMTVGCMSDTVGYVPFDPVTYAMMIAAYSMHFYTSVAAQTTHIIFLSAMLARDFLLDRCFSCIHPMTSIVCVCSRRPLMHAVRLGAPPLQETWDTGFQEATERALVSLACLMNTKSKDPSGIVINVDDASKPSWFNGGMRCEVLMYGWYETCDGMRLTSTCISCRFVQYHDQLSVQQPRQRPGAVIRSKSTAGGQCVRYGHLSWL